MNTELIKKNIKNINLFETAFLCVFKLNSNVIFEELVRQNVRHYQKQQKTLN